MNSLAILGASGHGKVVAEAAMASGWNEVCFFDDAWPDKGSIGAWSIVGDTNALLQKLLEFDGVAVAIGNNATRLEKIRVLHEVGAHLPIIAHPSAVLSPSARLNPGVVIMAGVVVNADAVIGQGAILNTACTVDHDCALGEGVHISPGVHLAGGVVVGASSWVGIGAAVKQGVCLGQGVVVGAGAVVLTDVASSLTVVGVPAKPVTR